MRILIAAEHSSARFGGEALLPLNYFQLLRRRGIDAWLITHARTEAELRDLLPDEINRIRFVKDTWSHRVLNRLSAWLPRRVAEATLGLASQLLTQWMERRLALGMIGKHGIDVVHQPIPVSPKSPSLLFGMGIPVVIGPMNGGMEFPPAFQYFQGNIARRFLTIARACSDLANLLIPGKVLARVLLVANRRTKDALPRSARGEIVELVENGVDLSIWSQQPLREEKAKGAVQFVFMGRLVDWKAIDLLLEAFRRASERESIFLQIVGDGPLRGELEILARALGVEDKVNFTGWLSQPECARVVTRSEVLVLSSLFECGGAVVLEAMAAGLPVIATKWGGPTDYVDETCGILIDPSSREDLITGFAAAMVRLAQCPATRRRLGEAGRARVRDCFDWEKKIDRILKIYETALKPAGVQTESRNGAGK